MTEQSQDSHTGDCSELRPRVRPGALLGEAYLATTKGPQRFILVSDYLFGVIEKSTTGSSLQPFLTVLLQPFLTKRQSFAAWKAFGFGTLDVFIQDGLHGLDPTLFLILG
jgi:hypothetical protein